MVIGGGGMSQFDVYTQADLDAALTKATATDVIVCRGSGSFKISDSTQVRAYDSTQVTAYDSTQVTAYHSAQVTAYHSAQVTAYHSAQVTAYHSVQVTAYYSTQVRAYDSVQVTAYDLAQVRAYHSVQVRAYDSAQVTASRFVAVTAHGQQVSVDGGGVLIQIPVIRTAAEWLEYHGVPVVDGIAVLFKTVSSEFISGYGMSYAPGTTPEAPDWDATVERGGGLHFCARPVECLSFYDLPGYRFVACPVRVDEIVVRENAMYPNKVKAPRVALPCYECDIDGNRVTETTYLHKGCTPR